VKEVGRALNPAWRRSDVPGSRHPAVVAVYVLVPVCGTVEPEVPMCGMARPDPARNGLTDWLVDFFLFFID
jgi:hypothetical protein